MLLNRRLGGVDLGNPARQAGWDSHTPSHRQRLSLSGHANVATGISSVRHAPASGVGGVPLPIPARQPLRSMDPNSAPFGGHNPGNKKAGLSNIRAGGKNLGASILGMR